MKAIFSCLLLSFLFFFSHAVNAQCSDAGFCSIGGLKASQHEKNFSAIVFTQSLGVGEKQTLHLSFEPEMSLKVLDKTNIQLKIPLSYVTGNLATTYGFGDLTAGMIQTLVQKEKFLAKITLAGKFALQEPGKTHDNKPLPMAYQQTLGTNDVIAGISFFTGKWAIGAGYQQPLNRNSSEFLHSRWNGDEIASQYFESNHLKRAPDVMLRVERNFRLAPGKKLFIGLLPIYRLQEDVIEDEAGNDIALDRSDGLTLNLSTNLLFELKNYNLKLGIGNPIFLTRKVRPDGLTRTVNFTFQVEERF